MKLLKCVARGLVVSGLDKLIMISVLKYDKNDRNKYQLPINEEPEIEDEEHPSAQVNKIVNLINTLENESDALNKVSIALMMRDTSNMLDSFQANMEEMESEFKKMLESYKGGTFSTADFEMLLEGERKKGQFTMDLAEEMVKLLGMLFNGIRDVVTKLSNGVPLNETPIDSVVEVLDQSMESVMGISRLATSLPKNVLRNMNIVQIKKSNLTEQPDRGHFATILQQFQQGHLISNLDTKELTFEEAIKAFSKNGTGEGIPLLEEQSDDSPNDMSRKQSSTPVHKSVRIHTFKVESAYLTRPPAFVRPDPAKISVPQQLKSSLMPVVRNASASSSPDVTPHSQGGGSTELSFFRKAMEKRDFMGQTESTELSALETSSAFSISFLNTGSGKEGYGITYNAKK